MLYTQYDVQAHWGHPLQGYDAHVERYRRGSCEELEERTLARNSPVMSSQAGFASI